jgi:hypothetical protein
VSGGPVSLPHKHSGSVFAVKSLLSWWTRVCITRSSQACVIRHHGDLRVIHIDYRAHVMQSFESLELEINGPQSSSRRRVRGYDSMASESDEGDSEFDDEFDSESIVSMESAGECDRRVERISNISWLSIFVHTNELETATFYQSTLWLEKLCIEESDGHLPVNIEVDLTDNTDTTEFKSGSLATSDKALESMEKLRVLNLANAEDLLGTCFASMNCLRKLTLDGCFSVKDKAFAFMPSLTYLDLSGCDELTNKFLQAVPHLQVLKLDFMHQMTDAVFKPIPNLRALQLCQCSNVKLHLVKFSRLLSLTVCNQSLSEQACKNVKGVEMLQLSRVENAQTAFANLIKDKSLRRLHTDTSLDLSKVGLSCLARLSILDLEVSGENTRGFGAASVCLFDDSCLDLFPHLLALTVANCDKFTGKTLPKAKHLLRLTVRNCAGFKSANLAKVRPLDKLDLNVSSFDFDPKHVHRVNALALHTVQAENIAALTVLRTANVKHLDLEDVTGKVRPLTAKQAQGFSFLTSIFVKTADPIASGILGDLYPSGRYTGAAWPMSVLAPLSAAGVAVRRTSLMEAEVELWQHHRDLSCDHTGSAAMSCQCYSHKLISGLNLNTHGGLEEF